MLILAEMSTTWSLYKLADTFTVSQWNVRAHMCFGGPLTVVFCLYYWTEYIGLPVPVPVLFGHLYQDKPSDIDQC